MNAVAKYDFEGSQDDELSFRRGQKLFVTSKEDEGGWYIACHGNHSGFIPATYIEMEPHEWYKEKMGRNGAEKMLLTKNCSNGYVYPDGAFIIRKSESDVNGFALSVKHEATVQHFKILRDGKNKFYIWPNVSFFCLNELVQRYKSESVSGDPKRVIYLLEISQEIYKALYDFAPANDEELELRRGDLIKVIAKCDPNWWEGEVDNRRGFFPKNYVQQIV